MSTNTSQSISEAPPSNASLMKLPAELRNQIFELVYIQRNAYNGDRKTLDMYSLLRKHKRILNNMIVSKQYQAEASALFWGSNVFQIRQSGDEDLRVIETDGEGCVTKGLYDVFKSIAHASSMQVKVIATDHVCWSEDTPSVGAGASSSDGLYTALLPPARYIPLIKNIVFVIPVPTPLLQGDALETAIKSENTDLGAQSWLRAVSTFDVLGFQKMEKVTFCFESIQFEREQKAALKQCMLDSKIDSMEVKVVFQDVASFWE